MNDPKVQRKAYTREERAALIAEARKTAAKLLKKLEQLAQMDGVHESEMERTQADDGDANRD